MLSFKSWLSQLRHRQVIGSLDHLPVGQGGQLSARCLYDFLCLKARLIQLFFLESQPGIG